MDQISTLRQIAITHDYLRTLHNIWAFCLEDDHPDKEALQTIAKNITEAENKLIELKAEVCI